MSVPAREALCREPGTGLVPRRCNCSESRNEVRPMPIGAPSHVISREAYSGRFMDWRQMEEVGLLLDRLLGLSASSAHELTTGQVCLRAVVVYFVLILFVRVGKKRFLGQATAFDAVLIIMIGSLASRSVSGTAPFVATLAATLVFVLVHWLISYLSVRSATLSFLVKGNDTLLIKHGRLNRNALRDAHMSSDDLDEDLREQGVGKLQEVKEARLERSGKVSVIRK
jgi:hypothetical protein